jgi:hypothetical protein
MIPDIGIIKTIAGKFMKVSPQDNVRIVLAKEQLNNATLDKTRHNRETEHKLSLEAQENKARIEQEKFVQKQFQKLLDGVYTEKAQQNAMKMKGTNVDRNA